MRYRCLLFDLDGTLIDSRDDLATAINLMLKELGRRPLISDHIVGFIGQGMPTLVRRALHASFARAATVSEVKLGIEIFNRHYGIHMLDRTHSYQEVTETLDYFRDIPKAVVTNKSLDFTLRILEGLELIQHFETVLGGDSLPERKPSPKPLIEAARRCQSSPKDCLMVGDSQVDILAGQSAHMKTCGFIAGFRGRTELERAGADYLIERFSELPGIVDGIIKIGS